MVDSGSGSAPVVDLGAYERQSSSCINPTIYVNQAASGKNNGHSWADAFVDLQDGLTLARACGPAEIWVAQGIYTPGLTQSDTFTLTDDIQLYGGFAGNETVRSQRNYTTNLTVLSGDIGGDDLTDTNGVVTATDHISGSNNTHVVLADGSNVASITEDTILDGFTITAGHATGSGIDGEGGGFYCKGAVVSVCNPSLSHVTFSGNLAKSGGAMFLRVDSGGNSHPSLSHVTFSGNRATENGGAIATRVLQGSSKPTFYQVSFVNNSAQNGGAIYNYGWRTHSGARSGDSSPILTEVTFLSNTATDSGGAIYNNAAEGGTSSPLLSHVTFSGNTATGSGGAMYNFAKSSGDIGTSSPILSHTTFISNVAGTGGGAIYSTFSRPTLTNVRFYGNRADSDGGAMYNNNTGDGWPRLTNVLFSGNSAVANGGAMGNNAGSNEICSPTLVNVTFSRNAAANGGAIYNMGTSLLLAAPACPTSSYGAIQLLSAAHSFTMSGPHQSSAIPSSKVIPIRLSIPV